MNLAECLEVEETGSKLCKLAEIREAMPPENQEILDGWLANKEMPAYTIAKALKAHKTPCSSTTIGNHRRGACACFTS